MLAAIDIRLRSAIHALPPLGLWVWQHGNLVRAKPGQRGHDAAVVGKLSATVAARSVDRIGDAPYHPAKRPRRRNERTLRISRTWRFQPR